MKTKLNYQTNRMEIDMKKDNNTRVTILSYKMKDSYILRSTEFVNGWPIEKEYTKLAYSELPVELAKLVNEYIYKGYKLSLIISDGKQD